MSLGVIQSIREVEGIKRDYHHMDGYCVQTDRHRIHVLIDGDQQCCEHWGYLQSEEDLGQYVGATLHEVYLTDTACQRIEVPFLEDDNCIQFVDFVTSRGVFQLAVYNSHNGFYGHAVLVRVGRKVLVEGSL